MVDDQKRMETNILNRLVSKDVTLDLEFVGLTKKLNYTDSAIHVCPGLT